MKIENKIYNDFSKGLITDFNSINQDKNACLELSNFIINDDGSIQKRKGLAIENNNISLGIMLPDILENKVVTSYVWKQRYDPIDILILQVGYKLYFYKYGKEISGNKLADEINLLDFLTSDRLLFEDIRLSFVEISGKLICGGTQCTPFVLEYKSSVKATKLDISIRDYVGKLVNLKDDERPTVLTKEHLYNLYNQGWEAWAVFATYNKFGFYPSNSDIFNTYKKDTTNLGSRWTGIASFVRAYVSGVIPRFTTDDKEYNNIEMFFNNLKAQGGSNDVNEYYVDMNNSYGLESFELDDMLKTELMSKAPKGRVIKKVFNIEDTGNLVRRPILKKPDEDINRNKYNPFHIIDDIKDIFCDNNKIYIVCKLDKETGLFGGKQSSTEAFLDLKLNKYEIQNKINLDNGKRIYKSILDKDVSDSIGIEQDKVFSKFLNEDDVWKPSNWKAYSYFFTYANDFQQAYGYFTKQKGNNFDDYYSYNSNKLFLGFLESNINNPYDYKNTLINTTYQIKAFEGPEYTYPLKDFRYILNKNGNAISFKKNTSKDRYVGTTYPLVSFPQMIEESRDSFSYFNKTIAYSKNNINGRNIFCYKPAVNSFNEISLDLSNFDFKSILKYKDTNILPIIDNKKIEQLPVIIKSLSSYIHVIEINKDELILDGELLPSVNNAMLNFNDFYNTCKITLKNSLSLYDKMKRTYEIIARDRYASNKIKEEYKDNNDFFSVNKIIFGVNNVPSYNQNTGYKDFNKETKMELYLELDKQHNKPIAGIDSDGYRNLINVVSGDFIEYDLKEHNDNYVLLPNKNKPYDKIKSWNNTTDGWGDSKTDYAMFYNTLPIKLKDKKDLPQFTNLINYIFTKDIRMNYVNRFFNDNNFNTGKNELFHKDYDRVSFFPEWNVNQNFTNDENTFRMYTNNYYNSVAFNFTEEKFNNYNNNFFNFVIKDRCLSKVSNLYPYNSEQTLCYIYDEQLNNINSKYTQSTIDKGIRPTPFDLIETMEIKPRLNLNKISRKALPEKMLVQTFGFNNIYLPILAKDTNLKYIDQDETITESITDNTDMFITGFDGRVYNLHEIMNMKFSYNIPRSEIMPKIQAYRNEWTWEMDGGEPELVTEKIEIDPDNLEYENVIEEFRPNSITSFAGRIWYAGINSNKYNNTIFFSSVISNDFNNEINNCYSKNDPTSEFLNSSLMTDGGYLELSNCGEILTLKVISHFLIAVCSNGIYVITSDSYFNPTNYSINKISDIGCISKNSVEIVDNTLYYCGENGIYILEPNKISSDLVPFDLTTNRISKIYNSIPLSSKRFIKIKYDQTKGMLYFMYNTNEEVENKNPTYNSLLIFNNIKKCFFKFTIDNSKWKIKDLFINDYDYVNNLRCKLICSSETNIEIFEFKDEMFFDFKEFTFESKLKTTSQIVSSPSNNINGLTITTHLNNIENSECISYVNYDFNNSHKETKHINIFKRNNKQSTVFYKNLINGDGNNIYVSYTNNTNTDCHILGFEISFSYIDT